VNDEPGAISNEQTVADKQHDNDPPAVNRSAISWAAPLALGAVIGALLVSLGVMALVATGVFPLRSGTTSTAPTTPEARPVTSTALTPTESERIPIAERARPGRPTGPSLPIAIDLAPTNVPWAVGQFVRVTEEGGAFLRPYPVTEDELAAPSATVAPNADVEVISTFRLAMFDGNWWYVHIPDLEGGAGVFGWMREDLLGPVTAEGSPE
jgi:hypothetical protein